MKRQQRTLMKFDPAFGTPTPYPSEAHQYRDYHGTIAWLYNPWTGEKRHPLDIGGDATGLLILPPGEPIYAATDDVAPGVAPVNADHLIADMSAAIEAMKRIGERHLENPSEAEKILGRVYLDCHAMIRDILMCHRPSS